VSFNLEGQMKAVKINTPKINLKQKSKILKLINKGIFSKIEKKKDELQSNEDLEGNIRILKSS